MNDFDHRVAGEYVLPLKPKEEEKTPVPPKKETAVPIKKEK